MPSISLSTARKIILNAQGLAAPATRALSQWPPERTAVKADVLEAIRRMGALQIDTIHVVARSPYLCLWSRLGDYQPEWLDELLEEGALFEYWSHALCFLPSEDYPYYRQRMLNEKANLLAGDNSWTARWARDHSQAIDRVLNHIRQNGGAFSADFVNKDHPAGGWWNWKEEKIALEVLFLAGELMIARRRNFQRQYDLSERVLSKWADVESARRGANAEQTPQFSVDPNCVWATTSALAQPPDKEEVARFLTLKAVRALGVARPDWVSQYFYLGKKGNAARLEALAQAGLLLPVTLEGFTGPAYVHPDQLGMVEEAISGRLEPTQTTLLTPFDPLVSDRQRSRELFNFDYSIECYLPAPKRRYGYFSLPILHRGALVGRMDAKAHRSKRSNRSGGLFEVKSAHLEPGIPVESELVSALAGALRRLAAWHGTPEVVVRLSDPPELAARLAIALA